jgi:hypothetical protein
VKKVVKKIKKPFIALVENPLYGAAAVVVLVAVIGGVALLTLTGGGGNGTATTTTQKKKSKRDAAIAAAKKRKIKPAPVRGSPGTLDVARSVGRLAIAQARGRIKHPSGVSVRVSAAPRQTVTVDWQLSCYRAIDKSHRTVVAHHRYRTKPPSTRSLPLPMSSADECTVSVGAQLTKNGAPGRVKVFVIAG